MTHNLFNTRQEFKTGNGENGAFYSLPQLQKEGVADVSRLPISIRIVLESVLRNFDEGKKISEQDVKTLANWSANAERTEEVPFVVARVILQDFTGVPLLVDLAAMRSAVQRLGKDTGVIEPLVPVDLVIDHSVQVDYAGSESAYQRNMEMEFKRNEQRYRFLKWGTQAFNGFRVVPPGIGIVHQVNLEYLAKGVFERDGVYFPGYFGWNGFTYDDDQRSRNRWLGRWRNRSGSRNARSASLYFDSGRRWGKSDRNVAARRDGDRSCFARYGNAAGSKSCRKIC